jgi:alkaline phosphatase
MRWASLLCFALGCADSGPHSGIDASGHFDASAPDSRAPETGDGATPRRRPKNVILFMGDGMGPEQLSTARYLRTGPLRLDALEGPVLVSTDSLTTMASADGNGPATDSAAGATAIATGVHVDNGVISESRAGAPLPTLLEHAQREGKATGLLTTTYFYDASPAAFAAHRPSRDDYDAIVRQMLGTTQPDVVMGAPGPLFDAPSGAYDGLARDAGYAVLRGVQEFEAWEPTVPATTPRLLALFETDFVPATEASERFGMTPALERRADSPDPTLAKMVERALERLARDPEGFFLFAEDEIFDQIGHRGPAEPDWANRAYPAQAAALDDAIGVALDWVAASSSFDETLIVLVADHETGGYRYDRALGPGSGRFSEISQGGSYSVGNHTRTKTAVYARGPGSLFLPSLQSHIDTYRMLRGDVAP